VTNVVVTAAVIERGGTFLVTRRQQGVHLEGMWEFPGGKCEAGEDLAACLSRELREELAVDADVLDEIMVTEHAYEDRTVEIHFIRCRLCGEPIPQLQQEMRWARRDELGALDFPPADRALVELLGRPRARETSADSATGGLEPRADERNVGH
jgi:mutator protein MutT